MSRCWCCEGIVGRPWARAEFRWTTRVGNVVHLCSACTVSWILIGIEDGGMMFVRLEVLSDAVAGA